MRVSDLSLPLCLVGFFALFALACGGPAVSNSPSASGEQPPELTDDLIRERINGMRVEDIPEDGGSGEPIGWRFYDDEPKEINIVEKQINGTSATVVLDIQTTSSPRSREKKYLAGHIRVHLELQRGMVLRRWEVIDTENLTMKYKKLPPSSPQPDSDQDR